MIIYKKKISLAPPSRSINLECNVVRVDFVNLRLIILPKYFSPVDIEFDQLKQLQLLAIFNYLFLHKRNC